MILFRRFSAALALCLLILSFMPRPARTARLRYPASLNKLLTIDFEGPVFEDPGFLVKDHSLIYQDGVFHLFYIRGDQTAFGHASSTDLTHWQIHDTVMETGPESWDSYQIWAPHLVQHPEYDFHFSIFYTGVNSSESQVIYFATSSWDISHWNKMPFDFFQPYHGDPSWIKWDENRMSHFRDPFFFSENSSNYLLTTAFTRENYGAIALARSENMFIWEDDGPLYVHNNGNLLESSSLIKENGKYHLFFTESSVGGISHMAADSLTGCWDINSRAIIDPGHACELLDTGNGLYIFSRHTAYNTAAGKLYTIRFDTLSFHTTIPEVRKTRTLTSGWTRLWGTAFDNQPVYGNPYRFRGADTVDAGFEGSWWINTYEDFDGPIYGSAPGSIQGDTPRGAIRTDDFTVRGRSMRVLVGGGNKPDSCYIALCHAGNGEIIYSETGRNRNSMDERVWDLDPLRGRDVYLTIVDNASGDFGHINVDGIEERGRPLLPHPDSIICDEPGPKDTHPVNASGEAKKNRPEMPASPRSRVSNYPNPFNPSTTIRINSVPGSVKDLKIFSASGRLIKTIRISCDSDGRGYAEWNGKDRRGVPVTTGVYTAMLSSPSGKNNTAKLVLIR